METNLIFQWKSFQEGAVGERIGMGIRNAEGVEGIELLKMSDVVLL